MTRKTAPQIAWEKFGIHKQEDMRGRRKAMKRKKQDWWIGTGQVYVDHLGYARGVVIHEREGVHVAVGPLGTVAPVKEKSFKTKTGAKRAIEKELRDAGY